MVRLALLCTVVTGADPVLKPPMKPFSHVCHPYLKNWGWHMWDEDRLTMRFLTSLTGFNGAGSELKKIAQESEDGQST